MECISPDFLIMSPDYAGTMSSVVIPFLQDRETQITLTTPDGTESPVAGGVVVESPVAGGVVVESPVAGGVVVESPVAGGVTVFTGSPLLPSIMRTTSS